jgi:hypothetical protein
MTKTLNYLEIIELRSDGKNIKLIGPEIAELIDKLNRGLDKPAVKLFINAIVENDFSIHIQHDLKNPDADGSPLGQQLITILKEFGLTHHSIWIEQLTK